MVKIYLLLGGNLGDKRQVFEQTRHLLNEQVGKVIRQSHIYETEPWGFESTDLFWNQVIELSVSITAEQVLEKTQAIEHQLGRIRKARQYDSRIIDIDILFYGDQVISADHLIIPHPRLQERRFALVPMNDIAPGFQHPLFHKSIAELLAECTDRLKVERVK